MSTNRANVTSTEAIADFRNALLVYASKLRPMLDDSNDYVMRSREYLRVDRRLHWENQMRQSSARLTEAQQAVFGAELSRLRAPSAAELAAVQRHKRDLAKAEEKLRILKKVLLHYDRETQGRMKAIEHLRACITLEIPKAARHLERLLESLEAYSAGQHSAPPTAATAPAAELPTKTDGEPQTGA